MTIFPAPLRNLARAGLRIRVVLTLVLLLGSSSTTLAAGGVHKSWTTFRGIRHEVLNLIGSARKQIWMSTSYFTDGEIVSAVYLARYRGIDVRVLLGRQKSRAYMSRLNYLKKQKTPVYLIPPGFPAVAESSLLVDSTLYLLDTPLDFLTRRRSFTLRQANPKEARRWIDAFAAAMANPVEAIPRRIPLVGRPGATWRQGKPTRPYKGENDGSYNYDRSRSASGSAPADLPRSLPKAIMYQKRLDQKPVKSVENPQDPPATGAPAPATGKPTPPTW